MENTAPTRSLSRRASNLRQVSFFVFSLGVLITVVGILLRTIYLIPTNNALFGLYSFTGIAAVVGGILIILIAIGLFIRAFTRRTDNDMAMVTGNFLTETGSFDGRFSFIRNINRPGLGYIDAVMIGPPGVLVFRILDSTGNYANEAANWMMQRADGDWQPFRAEPTREVVKDIRVVRDYLAKNNVGDIPVFGIIVFTAGPGAVQIAEKEPVVPISHLHTLVNNLGKQYLSTYERIPQEAVSAIRRILLA
jgi:hypothetical protein